MTFPAYEQIGKDVQLGFPPRFRQVSNSAQVPIGPNAVLWTLEGLPGVDWKVDRVARWFRQWPEALAYETRTNIEEISHSTGLLKGDVQDALAALDSLGYWIHRGADADGSFWFLRPLVPRHLQPQETPAERPARQSHAHIPTEEKRAISPGLRWDVLARDNHRCKGCGAAASGGTVLHIDHIKPFSKGGLTVLENLQTLCRECNAGKFNKWESP